MTEYTLGEICELKTGITFKTSDYTPSGTPVLRVRNIQNGKVETQNVCFCDNEYLLNSNLVKPENIVIATAGKGSVGKLGKNQTNEHFLYTADLALFIWNDELAHENYMFHYLNKIVKY